MIALLRKDSIWLLFVGLGGLVAGLLAMADAGSGLWYRHDVQSGEVSLLFYWIVAGVLGLCAGLFEDVTFTGEYLRHRPVSSARLFWTRQLGCAVVLATWILVMPALHLAGVLIFQEDGVLAQPGRWWSLVNQGSVGVAFYAVALFSAVVVRRVLLSVVLAFVLSLALLLFFALAAYEGPSAPVFYLLLAPISFALAAPLLLASLRISRDHRDLDRPVSRPKLVAAGIGVALVSLALSTFLHMAQLDVRRDVHARYPKIARFPDGAPVLVAQHKYKNPWRVDAQHRRIEGSVEKTDWVFEPRGQQLFPREEAFASRGRLSNGVRYQRVSCATSAFCYVGSDGLLHLFAYDADEGPVMVKHVGKEGGARFSSRAQVLGSWGRVALIADLEDGGVWRYDLQKQAGAFTRVALPAGDRFVENLTYLVRLPREDPYSPYPVVVRGERGVYVPDRDGLRNATGEVLEAVEQLDRRRAQGEAHVQLSGPVHFRVTLPATAVGPAFSHDYAPRTIAERAFNLQMQSLSLLRAPLLTVLTLAATPNTKLGNPTDEDARILLDPMVLLGGRWALALNLLLGTALTYLTFRRLGRLGVPGARRGFWSGLVLVSGLLGYIVYRACENGRAWRAIDLTQAKPPLLIQSAA